MSEFRDNMKPAAGTRWKHFKTGTVYEVEGQASSTDNPAESLVLYHAVDEPHRRWARRRDEFVSDVKDRFGKIRPRFEEVHS